MFKNNIVYNISDLSLNQKIELIKQAHSTCNKWFAESLDCSKSCARQSIEMAFEDLLKDFNNNSELHVLKRYDVILDGYLCEIAFVIHVNSIQYFFWSYLKNVDFKYLIEGYNLQLLKY